MDMFKNENKNHKKLILTPYYQIDIACFNKKFLMFLKNVWCSFVQLGLDLKMYVPDRGAPIDFEGILQRP